jgi:inosine-uridine nucleoside N-ribohydrolase
MRPRRSPRPFAFTGLALLPAVLAFAITEAQAPAPAAPSGAAPVNVIFDTDIWSDIDDMMALAMLHALHDRHEVNLVAVTISTDDHWCASYVDLVDTFYGHSEIPIGIVHDGMTVTRFRQKFPGTTWPSTRYTELISEEKTSRGAFVYPHHLVDGARAAEAVSLLRKTLAAQPDNSVVMMQVGYSTNLARLLDTGADAASPLTGRDLVARKVRLLSVMAGNFGDAEFRGTRVPKGTPEFNLVVDVPAAQKVFSTWPTPIVASGYEIGLSLPYPGRSIEHDYTYVRHHPIADAYRTFCEEWRARDTTVKRCPHDHPTFDLTAVLYGARPDGNYFTLSKPGKITVLDDGSSRFDESDGGNQRHLILTDDEKARALEALVMLTSQPPRSGNR